MNLNQVSNDNSEKDESDEGVSTEYNNRPKRHSGILGVRLLYHWDSRTRSGCEQTVKPTWEIVRRLGTEQRARDKRGQFTGENVNPWCNRGDARNSSIQSH